MPELDAISQIEALDVGRRDGQGRRGHVGRDDPGGGRLEGQRDRENAAAGADVDDVRSPSACGLPLSERRQPFVDDQLGFRPWDEHRGGNDERPAVELALARDVGDGFATEAPCQRCVEGGLKCLVGFLSLFREPVGDIPTQDGAGEDFGIPPGRRRSSIRNPRVREPRAEPTRRVFSWSLLTSDF